MPISGPSDYTDDLRLAHVLADDADSLIDVAVQGARPARDEQARPDAGDRRRPGRRGGHPPYALARPVPRRRPRRGAGIERAQPAAVDHRPDRRHQELRPRRARLGHPDRAGRRRRGRARRRLRAGAAATLVGVEGRRRLDRPLAAEGDEVRGLRRTPPGGRLAVLQLAVRLGRARPPAGLHLAVPPLLAHPRVRRLLVLHAAGRGHRRPGRRARARALRHGRPRRDRARGGRPVHRPRRRPTGPTAATRSRATGTSTTRRWRSSARCRTTTPTRTRDRAVPARCTTSGRDRPRRPTDGRRPSSSTPER